MSADAFQDFSYATHWEKSPLAPLIPSETLSLSRFAGEIEQVLRRWLWTQEGGLTPELCTVELKQKLHFRKEPYILSLQLPGEQTTVLETPGETSAPVSSPESEGSYSASSSSDDGEDFEFLPQEEPVVDLDSKSEKPRSRSNPIFSKGLFVSPVEQFDDDGAYLQRWFGLSRFVLLRAGSQSGRILDAQEASTLLSAAAIALAEFPRPLPILVPLQNSFRDAFRGVAVVEGCSVFLDVDSSHLTQQSEHLRSVVGQLQVFGRQLHRYSPKGARLCEDIACGVESAVDSYDLGVSSCVTYKLPLPTTAASLKEAEPEKNLDQLETQMTALWSDEWDEGCVWQPWAAQKDPIASLELDLIWSNVELTSSNPTPVLSAMSAAQWRVYALAEERHAYESWAIFSSKDSFNRRQVRFPSVGEIRNDAAVKEFDGDNFRSLASRLNALLQAVCLAEAARSVSDLGSEEWWDDTGTRGPSIPPESVFKESLCDMFGADFSGQELWSMTEHVEYSDAASLAEIGLTESKAAGRCALSRLVPLNSLTSRLGLHAVVYRNARAVALLWTQFVQVVRVQYWEKLRHIPLIPFQEATAEPEAPDMNACLIHQKLQMLNVCIHRLVERRRTKSRDSLQTDGSASDYGSCVEEVLSEMSPANGNSHKARGVAGVLEGAFIEGHPDIPINIPLTQLMPVHTSDSLMEEETLLSALHDSPEDQERAAREQAKVLLSDMAAFKAANPEAQLSDFVKWHSPKDWVKQENGEGRLSQRMSHETDNRWMKLWSEVEPSPASEQIPLFDPAMAGERALYSLETIEPVKLFTQLFQIGVVSCFACLQRAQCGKFKRIQQEAALFHKALKEGLCTMEHHPEQATELLELFKSFERAVVAGESLLRHLPQCEATVEYLLDRILLNPLDASVPAEGSRYGVLVSEAEKDNILSLLLHTAADSSSKDATIDENGKRKRLIGTVLQHEWVITCRKKSTEGDQGELCHRLYFKDAVNEVRLGTVLVSEL